MRRMDLSLGNLGWVEVEGLPAIRAQDPPALVLRSFGPAGGRLASVILTPVEAGRLCGALLAEADDLLGTTATSLAIQRAIVEAVAAGVPEAVVEAGDAAGP